MWGWLIGWLVLALLVSLVVGKFLRGAGAARE